MWYKCLSKLLWRKITFSWSPFYVSSQHDRTDSSKAKPDEYFSQTITKKRNGEFEDSLTGSVRLIVGSKTCEFDKPDLNATATREFNKSVTIPYDAGTEKTDLKRATKPKDSGLNKHDFSETSNHDVPRSGKPGSTQPFKPNESRFAKFILFDYGFAQTYPESSVTSRKRDRSKSKTKKPEIIEEADLIGTTKPDNLLDSSKDELTSPALYKTYIIKSVRPKTTNLCEQRVQSNAVNPETADNNYPYTSLSVNTDSTDLSKRRHSTGSTTFIRYGFGHAFQPLKLDSSKADGHLTDNSKKAIKQSKREDCLIKEHAGSSKTVPNQAGATSAESAISSRSAAFIKYGFGHAFSKFFMKISKTNLVKMKLVNLFSAF